MKNENVGRFAFNTSFLKDLRKGKECDPYIVKTSMMDPYNKIAKNQKKFPSDF